ncbi:hypothetical protein [Phenylobacterium sp.]|uniref:hypothetical protein n=1 Tax=Phenylobacterium sp. TaxID=1871053 RepID=UPI002ED8622D
MNFGRADALSSARKLVRMLDGPPDPLRQAQAAVALLIKEPGWAPAEERQILDLPAWLAQRPPPAAVKPRCQAVLRALVG